MVQEVVSVDPELHALGLGDLKVLKDRHVPVEERWAVGDGQKCRPVLPHRSWCSKAVRIDKLMPTQARVRIAGHDWVELYRIRPQNRLVVNRDSMLQGITGDAIRRTGNNRCTLWTCHSGIHAGKRHVEVSAAV